MTSVLTTSVPDWCLSCDDAAFNSYDGFCEGGELYTLQSPFGACSRFIWDDKISHGPSTSGSASLSEQSSVDTRHSDQTSQWHVTPSSEQPKEDAGTHSNSNDCATEPEVSADTNNVAEGPVQNTVRRKAGTKRTASHSRGRRVSGPGSKRVKVETCLIGILQPFSIVKAYSSISQVEDLNRRIQQLVAAEQA